MIRRSGSESDTAFFDAQKDAISTGDMVVVIINTAVGVGTLSLGYTFRMGLGFALIMMVLFAACNYYSMFLFVKVAQLYRRGTFEEIWTLAFSRRSSYICAVVSVAFTVLSLVFYFRVMYQCLYLVVDYLFDVEGTWLEYEYFYLLGVDLVLIIPMCFSESLQDIAKIAYVGNTCAIILLIHELYQYTRHLDIYGFDPDSQFAFFSFTTEFAKQFNNVVTAYMFVPFSWPGLRHLHNPTQKRWWMVFGIITGVLIVYYCAMGTLAYLTFFDENEATDTSLQLYPRDSVVAIAAVIVTLKIASVAITSLNQARFITLSSLAGVITIDRTVWTCCGIGWTILGTFGATISKTPLNILTWTHQILAPILLCIIPPVLYLRSYRTRSRGHALGSIILVLIGLVCIANTIYYAVTST